MDQEINAHDHLHGGLLIVRHVEEVASFYQGNVWFEPLHAIRTTDNRALDHFVFFCYFLGAKVLLILAQILILEDDALGFAHVGQPIQTQLLRVAYQQQVIDVVHEELAVVLVAPEVFDGEVVVVRLDVREVVLNPAEERRLEEVSKGFSVVCEVGLDVSLDEADSLVVNHNASNVEHGGQVSNRLPGRHGIEIEAKVVFIYLTSDASTGKPIHI